MFEVTVQTTEATVLAEITVLERGHVRSAILSTFLKRKQNPKSVSIANVMVEDKIEQGAALSARNREGR